MSKIVTIDECPECKYCLFLFKPFCEHEDAERDLDDIENVSIPTWCPLEDAPPTNNESYWFRCPDGEEIEIAT